MTVSVVTTAAAEDDIRDIAKYIAQDSATAAKQFGEDFVRVMALIREFPRIGRPIIDEVRAIRVSRRFWRYLVFYHLVAGKDVKILRVLHGGMDISKHFDEGS